MKLIAAELTSLVVEPLYKAIRVPLAAIGGACNEIIHIEKIAPGETMCGSEQAPISPFTSMERLANDGEM